MWITLFYQLPLDGITRNIAANCLLRSAGGDRIELDLDSSQKSVFNDEHKRRINKAFNDYFGRELTLEISAKEISGETPAAFRVRKEQERLRKAIETFENDDYVREIVERFSGDIQVDSIIPTTPKQY